MCIVFAFNGQTLESIDEVLLITLVETPKLIAIMAVIVTFGVVWLRQLLKDHLAELDRFGLIEYEW